MTTKEHNIIVSALREVLRTDYVTKAMVENAFRLFTRGELAQGYVELHNRLTKDFNSKPKRNLPEWF